MHLGQGRSWDGLALPEPARARLRLQHGTASHRNNVQLGQFGRNRSNVWHYPGANSFGRGGDENLFEADVVLIEDKASGTQLIQELIAEGCHGLTRYQPTSDKTMRLHAQTAVIENGFVYLPETAPWIAEYLQEVTVFPNGKHDDQVDSTAQFLDWFKRPSPCQGIFEYTRQLAAAAGHQKPQPARPEWAVGCVEWLAEQSRTG